MSTYYMAISVLCILHTSFNILAATDEKDTTDVILILKDEKTKVKRS